MVLIPLSTLSWQLLYMDSLTVSWVKEYAQYKSENLFKSPNLLLINWQKQEWEQSAILNQENMSIHSKIETSNF